MCLCPQTHIMRVAGLTTHVPPHCHAFSQAMGITLAVLSRYAITLSSPRDVASPPPKPTVQWVSLQSAGVSK